VINPKRIASRVLASRVGAVVDGAVNFADSPDDARFRAALRAWLGANRPGRAERVPHDDVSLADEFAFLRDWQRRLYDAGYVGLLWPREYGGRGAPPTQQAILNEELAPARCASARCRSGTA
jgi:alkylation response protein AidB-like acyl-CoA dehydrogenase